MGEYFLGVVFFRFRRASVGLFGFFLWFFLDLGRFFLVKFWRRNRNIVLEGIFR